MEEPRTLGEVWLANAKVEATYEETSAGPNVTISANREGLRMLAKLLLFVSRHEHGEFYDIHFDEYSSSAEGYLPSSNVGLTFQKCDLEEPPNR